MATVLTVAVLAWSCGSDTDKAAGGEDRADEPSGAAVDGVETAGEAETADGVETADEAETLFPDVLEATATLAADGTWTFSATLSSPYDTPERYADGWRVIGADGTVYGTRVLTHDHRNEQPFTRSQGGIEIPADVELVTVQGRDQVSGWGGETVEVRLIR